MKFKYGFLTLLVGMVFFTSCAKENEDVTTMVEGTNTPQVVECKTSLGVGIDDTNERLIANVKDGERPYSYKWSTGETTESILPTINTNIDLEVTDADGCTVNKSVAFQGSSDCEIVSLLVDYDEDNNSLTATVTGGSQNYFLNWSTGESVETIVVVSGNSYSIDSIDSMGCTITVTYMVP